MDETTSTYEYVCMCIKKKCVTTHKHTHTHTCMSVSVYASYMCANTDVNVYTCQICKRTHKHHASIDKQTNTHTHTYMCVCVFICMYVYTYKAHKATKTYIYKYLPRYLYASVQRGRARQALSTRSMDTTKCTPCSTSQESGTMAMLASLFFFTMMSTVLGHLRSSTSRRLLTDILSVIQSRAEPSLSALHTSISPLTTSLASGGQASPPATGTRSKAGSPRSV
jgi:hypothetical protein